MRAMIEEAERICKVAGSGKSLLLHCWRGGMRSSAVAWLLDFYGFDVFLLEGGYKAYRHWVIAHWKYDGLFRILGGYTGSGKTEILMELNKIGEPVLDLEGLARHRGSAFGGLDKSATASQEMFENLLAAEIEMLRQKFGDKAIWIEDESQRIGNVNIPNELFRIWHTGKPVLFLDIPFEQRLDRIVREYGGYSTESLINAIIRIKKRLGPLETKTAVARLIEGNVRECFRILLTYYDKHYYVTPSKHASTPQVKAHHKSPLQSNTIIMDNNQEKIKLTQFAKAAGCSCKIAPAQLREILGDGNASNFSENLIVGNNTSDDAAVYRLDAESSLIATTDFFTPVVDDAYDYGRIAAANALSDVYAMGGKPLLALAILGWPVDVLPPALASAVLDGARAACLEAGIPLAGGHSIITSEPVFGLSVNGVIANKNLKQNSTAQEGDLILLTKAIGSGILTTANKRGLLEESGYAELLAQLTALNKIGEALGGISGITAMTDVTGFGLGGHLYEMATGSGLTAEIGWSKVPLMQSSKSYAAQRISPDATFRNWNSISADVAFSEGVNVMEAFTYLPDPQTNGGLLIAVRPDALSEVQALLIANGYSSFTEPIGRFIAKKEKAVSVTA